MQYNWIQLKWITKKKKNHNHFGGDNLHVKIWIINFQMKLEMKKETKLIY